MTVGPSFGERVVDARAAVRLRQRHLAHAAGLSPATINEIERDKSGRGMRARKLYDLARALGLRMESLLGLPYLGGPYEIEGDWSVVLGEAGKKYGWPLEDMQMLAHIHFRGRRPATVEDWWFIRESIARTVIK